MSRSLIALSYADFQNLAIRKLLDSKLTLLNLALADWIVVLNTGNTFELELKNQIPFALGVKCIVRPILFHKSRACTQIKIYE